MTEKMHQTVFYSWQSDLPNRTNRAFILDALEQAARAVRSDASVGVDPVVDRDTAGVAGSPEIAATIFAKIAEADIFVPDVSLVTSHHARRPSPNPNVLLELGFAMSELGWDRVVMVMNTAFGDPTRLPFDLRGHRVVTYNCSDEPGTIKTGEQRALEKELTDAITAIFREQASRRNAEDRTHLDSLHADAVEFQAQRLERLATGNAPRTMSSEQLVCVHVVPFDAKTGNNDTSTLVVSIPSALVWRRLVQEDSTVRSMPMVSFDMSLSLMVRRRDSCSFFATALCESVDSSMMMGREMRSDGLPGPYFCKTLLTVLDGACRLYEELQIQPPISVLIAHSGRETTPASVQRTMLVAAATTSRVSRNDRIVLPPVQLVDLKADIRPLLRRSLDALWQAAGVEACSCYTADGKWSASD